MLKKLLSGLIIVLVLCSVSNGQSLRGEQPIWVNNLSGSTLTNFQVLVRVNTQLLISLGLMQSQGQDIRFGNTCAPGSFYNYYLEGYINTDSTKLWVLVPSIPANDSVLIYMYFGNSGLSSTSTLDIFSGPNSSTDSVIVASQNTVSNCQRGFRFTPTQPLLVAYFGNRTPNGTQRYVTLFDFNSQAIVYQTQVAAGTSGLWHYDLLTQPFWVNSGQQYILELFNGSGDMYYYGISSQIGQHLTYGDMRYCNNCTQNTFPTTVLPNYHYGTPDFLYYIRQSATPEPTFSLRPPSDTNTPAAPTGLAGTPGNQQVFLYWNRNSEFDMSKYFVYRNTTNDPNSATLIDSVNHPDTAYTATGLTNGTTYYFWVKAVDRYCVRRVSGFSNVVAIMPVIVAHNENKIPTVFALHQNYPNPFNPLTKIKFDIPKGNFVRLTIFDITGREVDVPLSEYLAAGYYEVTFDAGNLASGAYFYKLEAGSFTDKKKMIIVK